MNHTPTKRQLSFVFIVLAASGCTSTNPRQFRNSFLPPAPPKSPQATYAIADPPVLTPNAYFSRESPTLLSAAPDLPPRPTQLDARIRRAEERFDAGRKLYAAGDLQGARSEFDRAIDILLNAPDTGDDGQRLDKSFDRLLDAIYRFDIEGFGAGSDGGQVAYDKSPLDDILQMTFPIDPKLKNKVKEEVRATVSQLPLEANDAILSYIHYFSSERGRKILVAGLRRSGRYRPMISRILDEEGVPQELIYLAQAESGFLPRALSRKAAAGVWQFVKWRGQQYGLNQTPYSDDRLDPERATRAAARHLRDLYTTFGDWYLAMAAYNCGPGCVERAVQRTGYADFWELRNRSVLPKETRNYVPVILAMTVMAKNAKDYDIEITPDPAVEYDTVELTAPTHVNLIADAADRSTSEIREFNPALLKNLAPAGYALRLPKGTGRMVASALDSVPAAKRASWRIHRVAPGETLTQIAKRYGAPAGAISAANASLRLEPETGDVLIIPASYSEPKATAQKRSTASRTARSRATAKRPVKKAAAPAPAKKSPASVQTASLRTSTGPARQTATRR